MPFPSLIAIDGPVASGKSTVGRCLARRLGYRFLDTGMMYRAVTLAAMEAGVEVENGTALAALARSLEIGVEEDRVLVNGRDVTVQLRDPRVEQHVARVSSYPEVRQVLVQHQRRMAREGALVMAGRDIGTVVLPGAPLKVFLTASDEERARRRHREREEQGVHRPFAEVLEELRQRDALDTRRAASPLRQAKDAHAIDTDDVDAAGVVQRILALMPER